MKKYFVFGLSSMVLALGLTAVVALAEDTPTPAPAPSPTPTAVLTAPMVLDIGPKGNVMLRGEVVSVGTDSLVVKSWGGSWDIGVSTTTKIVSINKVLPDFKAGDFVGVLGKVSQDGDFIIDARILREWGIKKDKDKDGIPDDQDDNQMSDFGRKHGEGMGGNVLKNFLHDRGPRGDDNKTEDDNSGSDTSGSGN